MLLKETKSRFGKVREFRTRSLPKDLEDLFQLLEESWQEILLRVNITWPFMHKMNGWVENQKRAGGIL